jgi:hypothetical protein
MPFLNRESFLSHLSSILHISLVSVHADLMKKLQSKEFVRLDYITNSNTNKNLNIRQSTRKKDLLEGDSLMKMDLHSIFVENFQVN